MKTVRMALIIAATLVLAALSGIMVTHADGPWLWREKCPTQQYQVVIDRTQKGVVVVSCLRMAQEVER